MLDNKEMLVEILGSLVKISPISQRVQIAHFSVRQYLLSQTFLVENRSNPDYIDFEKGHGEILSSCFKYLNSPNTQDSAVSGATAFEMYACTQWPVHARHVESDPLYRRMIVSFLHGEPNTAYRRWLKIVSEKFDPVYLVHDTMRTALFYAALFDLSIVVEKLLGMEKYADRDIKGCALIAAVAVDSIPIIDQLLKGDINVNICSIFGVTALHFAVGNNDIDLTRALVSRGASISCVTQTERCPLDIAVEGGYLEVAKILLETGADITFKFGHRQLSPLHLAAWYRQPRMLALFLRHLKAVDASDADNELLVTADDFDAYHIQNPPTSDTTVTRPLPSWEGREANLDLYRLLLKTFPEDHIFYEYAGDAYFEQKLYKEAYALYHRGLCLNPQNLRVTCIEELMHCDFCYHCGYYSTEDQVIKGYRYRCTICPDFDLCTACFALTPFPHDSHEFKCIPSVEWVAARFDQLPANSKPLVRSAQIVAVQSVRPRRKQ